MAGSSALTDEYTGIGRGEYQHSILKVKRKPRLIVRKGVIVQPADIDSALEDSETDAMDAADLHKSGHGQGGLSYKVDQYWYRFSSLSGTLLDMKGGGMVTVNPFSEAWRRKLNTKPSGPIYFGPFEVTPQVFLTTPYSFALVNLKPLLPGHVLICPHKPHRRLTDLSAPELTDLFQAVQRVQRMLARHYFTSPSSSSSTANTNTNTTISSSSFSTAGNSGNVNSTTPAPAPAPAGSPEAGSFNIAIQDGSGAGQTVDHVHVHVIPRIAGWTDKDPSTVGDAIYQRMASEEGNVGGALWDRDRRPVPGGAFAPIEDASRRARTMEEMVAEAELFRGVLAAMAREELRREGEERGGREVDAPEEGAAGGDR
ncbi:hypothetical protein DL770_001375 [Monosporascus sp. CRB-9-2]|nr:hypothetical protein DL770_001375 [Monosporascus sp. CRB-9-2]